MGVAILPESQFEMHSAVYGVKMCRQICYILILKPSVIIIQSQVIIIIIRQPLCPVVGLSMSSPNDPVLCCPLPYRVAPVFVQVVTVVNKAIG